MRQLRQQSLFQESDAAAVDNPAAVKQPYTYREPSDLAESSVDAESGEITLTVLRPGANKSGTRFYPPDTLRRDFKVFEGCRMHLDHATQADDRARPEGSVKDWAGSLKQVWVEDDGAIRAKAAIFDESFLQRLARMEKHGLLGQMGVSIRAQGVCRESQVEGRKLDLVEKLTVGRSVDFVTAPGAGGRVERLRESDPGLEEVGMIDQDIAARLAALEQAVAEKDRLLQEAQGREAESERRIRKAEAREALDKALSESGLQPASCERLRSQFSECEDTAAIPAAVEAAKGYEAQLREAFAAPQPAAKPARPQVRNLGESTAPDSAPAGGDLAKAYQLMGLSETAASAAASVALRKTR